MDFYLFLMRQSTKKEKAIPVFLECLAVIKKIVVWACNF